STTPAVSISGAVTPNDSFRAFDTETKKWVKMGVVGGVERMYDARQFSALSVPGTAFLAWYSERRKTVNFRALPDWKATSLTSVPDSTHHDSPARRLPVPVSRRQFARTVAGGAFAAAVGSRLSLVEAASFAPVPIPGGSPALGGAYHVFGPAAFDPIDAEPITITNLDAKVGLASVSGMVTQTNIKTGDVVRLPFVNSDMRFMQGVFRGTDGKVHQGAFAFV
ncbi:MAG: hypothetical protein WBW14_21600, partial [Candidatus Acidiferrum sp.]